MFEDPGMEFEEKKKVLEKEMKVDYSDVDVLEKVRCYACLPEEWNKETLWNLYINKQQFSQEQFAYSTSSFYNKQNKQQCLKFGNKFFECIDEIK